MKKNNRALALGHLTEETYEIGRDKSGRKTPEFQRAIDTWKDVVKTHAGQLELIEAMRNRETDAINYFMDRSGGIIYKNYKKSTPAFSRGEFAENYENAYQAFVNEAYLMFLGDKSPVDTFKENRVSEDVDLIRALVIWSGRYFNKIAGKMRTDYDTAGIQNYGSKRLTVDSANFNADGSSSASALDLEPGFSRVGTDVIASGAPSDAKTVLVSQQDPTGNSIVADEESKGLLRRWVRFCKSPFLQGKDSVPGDAKAPAWLILKDYLNGEKQTTDRYLAKFGVGEGVSQASIHGKRKKTFEKLAEEFTREELEVLFSTFEMAKLATYLKPRVGAAA